MVVAAKFSWLVKSWTSHWFCCPRKKAGGMAVLPRAADKPSKPCRRASLIALVFFGFLLAKRGNLFQLPTVGASQAVQRVISKESIAGFGG
jgi:hypothetical protein